MGRQEADLTTVRAQDAQHQAELRLAIAEHDQQRSRLAASLADDSPLPSAGALVDPKHASDGDINRLPVQHGRLRDRVDDMVHMAHIVRGMHPPRTPAHSGQERPHSAPEPVAPRP